MTMLKSEAMAMTKKITISMIKLDVMQLSLPFYQINLSLQYEKISQRRVRS